MNRTTLNQTIEKLISKHGSLRAASRFIGVDHAYLHRLATGKKTQPSDAVLAKLGLSRETIYKKEPGHAKT